MRSDVEIDTKIAQSLLTKDTLRSIAEVVEPVKGFVKIVEELKEYIKIVPAESTLVKAIVAKCLPLIKFVGTQVMEIGSEVRHLKRLAEKDSKCHLHHY